MDSAANRLWSLRAVSVIFGKKQRMYKTGHNSSSTSMVLHNRRAGKSI